jgi:hypothetical protein
MNENGDFSEVFCLDGVPTDSELEPGTRLVTVTEYPVRKPGSRAIKGQKQGPGPRFNEDRVIPTLH